MTIVEIKAELHGDREVTVNGQRLLGGQINPKVEEKIIFNQLTLQQVWELLATLRKVDAMLVDTYHKMQVRDGETPMSDYERLKRDEILLRKKWRRV